MSASPRWSYVQARLQARHGERLREADWRALEAARSIDQFIERARATPLRRFSGRVHARTSSRDAERILREAWRAYVAEVAGWVTAAWRQAVLWTAYVPDLPIIDTLLAGEVPAWIEQDAIFAALAASDPSRRTAAPSRSPLAALLASGTQEKTETTEKTEKIKKTERTKKTIAARWYAHWRALWPRRRAADNAALVDLAATIAAHRERLDRAGLKETSAPYRGDLAHSLTRMFRRHSGAPAAVFCHLALVALDLERLRGDLVRRRLFEPSHATETA